MLRQDPQLVLGEWPVTFILFVRIFYHAIHSKNRDHSRYM